MIGDAETGEAALELKISGLPDREIIAVVGSSVSLYVRPPRKTSDEKTYAEHLREGLGADYWVTNLSRVSYDIEDAVDRFAVDLLPLSPATIIVHLGVNESASRLLPRRVWRGIYGGPMGGSAKLGLTRRGLALVDSAGRRVFTRVHSRAWFTEHEFEQKLMEFLGLIAKELYARVILVGVAAPSDRVEQQLRGSRLRAEHFNDILQQAAVSKGAHYISVADLPAGGGMTPDGIHFSAEGHRLLAQRLMEVLR